MPVLIVFENNRVTTTIRVIRTIASQGQWVTRTISSRLIMSQSIVLSHNESGNNKYQY